MFLLVSTPLQIFLLDVSRGVSSILRAGDGYYFGITCKQGSIVLTHSAGYLQYYRSKSHPVRTGNHLIQPHQSEWIEDKILVTNTGKNCLSVFDEQGQHIRDVFLNDIHIDDKDRGRLGNHFNSVHRAGDLVYVVAHNYEKPSEVLELSWPDLEIVNRHLTGASWAHNLWAGEMGLVICDSKHGGLYDVVNGETIWKSDDPQAFTRGLAVSREQIFVGCSVYQERKERYWKSGKVLVLDRQTLKLLDEINLPGSGDIQDIRIIDMLDECHTEEIISQADLINIRRISPFIFLAYQLRRKYPSLQKDVFPISAFVRGIQMVPRWKNTLLGN